MGFFDGSAGGIIGGAIDGLAGLFNAGKQYRNQKKLMGLQHQYNLEAMAQQNKYNVENWERNNEYNDPSAVAARYQHAGMDVNQAFGGSSHYTPSQQASGAAAVGTGAPVAPMPDMMNFRPILDALLVQAQIQKTKKETAKIEGDTITPEQRARLTELELATKRAGLEGQNLVNQQRELDLTFNQETYGLNVEMMKQRVETQRQTVANIIADTNLKGEQLETLITQQNLNIARVATEEALKKMYGAQAFLYGEQAKLIQPQIDNLIALTKKYDVERLNESLRSFGIRDEQKLTRARLTYQNLCNNYQEIVNSNESKNQKAKRFQVYSREVDSWVNTLIDGISVVLTRGLSGIGRGSSRTPTSEIDDFNRPQRRTGEYGGYTFAD